jgi:hypothetical protein
MYLADVIKVMESDYPGKSNLITAALQSGTLSRVVAREVQ